MGNRGTPQLSRTTTRPATSRCDCHRPFSLTTGGRNQGETRMHRNNRIWRVPTADTLALRVIFTMLILLGLSSTGRAQDSGAEVGRESLEGLTLRLVDLNAQHLAGAQSNNSQLFVELQTVVATRQQALAALAESNPGEVLRVSLPANVRATFLPPFKVSSNNKSTPREP